MTERPKVFISYPHTHVSQALEIYQFLERSGVVPWLDRKMLQGGDDWEHEIKKAVASACAVVVLLTPGFNKKGFRQKEVRWALEALEERPPGSGFIIPFALSPCELPDWCRPFHSGDSSLQASTLSFLHSAIEKQCKVDLPPLRFWTCYLSYSSGDRDFVRRLHQDLEDAGVPCWNWEQSLTPGSDVWHAIDGAIRASDRFLLIASAFSLGKPETVREIRRALEREDELYRETGAESNMIIPITLDDYLFKWEHSLKADITRRSVLHAQDWEDQSGYSRIRDDLLYKSLLQHG